MCIICVGVYVSVCVYVCARAFRWLWPIQCWTEAPASHMVGKPTTSEPHPSKALLFIKDFLIFDNFLIQILRFIQLISQIVWFGYFFK